MGSAVIRMKGRPYMAPIYVHLLKFACTPDKTPIYGLFHPFVFNNTGKATRGKANHGVILAIPPYRLSPEQGLSLFLQKKEYLRFYTRRPIYGRSVHSTAEFDQLPIYGKRGVK